MNPASRSIVPGIGLALLMPTILIQAFTPDGRLGIGLTCAPFGWPIVMIVHLIASLPIGLVTSAALGRTRRHPARWISMTSWTMVGLAGISALVFRGEDVASALARWDAGFVVRDVVRTVLAFLLVLPWLVVADRPTGPDPRIPHRPAAILVAATLAFLPPIVYANQFAENRSTDLKTQLGAGRLVKARSTLIGLSELGNRPLVDGKSPAQILRRLDTEIARMERDASHPLPPTASPQARLERAFLLIQLDRLDESEPILRSLAEIVPDALLLLGAVYRDQTHWSDSERAYRRALDSLLPGAARDLGMQERCATAYEGIAEASRSAGRPEDAEKAYQEARRRLPAKAGYFAFQLGRHYLSGGRPSEGIAQLRQAVQRDPTLESQVRPLILQAQTKTPACLLRSPDR